MDEKTFAECFGGPLDGAEIEINDLDFTYSVMVKPDLVSDADIYFYALERDPITLKPKLVYCPDGRKDSDVR